MNTKTQTPAARMVVQLTAPELAELVRQQVEEALEDAAAGPKLLGRNDLAQRLGCGLSLVDRFVKQGMPSIRVGDLRKFDWAAVLAWLQSRPTETPAESDS